ncbi:MAG TPA: hypothetical protein VHD62_01845 [Opitutaceae bacterium]|nr:hypothetical protein [Opitutaceae bacterium]
MKLSKLLSTRHSILRQAHLASLAYAHYTLERLAARAARGGLRGLVRLHTVEPDEERFWPTLTALEGPQSVLEEHFADEEIMELADAIALAVESNYTEIEFRIEELSERFAAPLREALARSGVVLDLGPSSPAPASDSASKRNLT